MATPPVPATQPTLRRRCKIELKRVRAELIVLGFAFLMFALLGISRANLETIIFKVALVSLASIVGHSSRQLMFPYLDLRSCIFARGSYEKVDVAIRAVLIAGAILIYCVFILGVVLAI